ncbi:hypothetical protein GOODEAATRI_006759 [Goodea atripinnis]|uniref:PDXDC1-like third domain-containing protein n=1 Tax=Goodea atripinnis TaxID=208336 RepID=A0ABV0PVU9_9TELE
MTCALGTLGILKAVVEWEADWSHETMRWDALFLAYIVSLPHRPSFRPRGKYYTGKTTGDDRGVGELFVLPHCQVGDPKPTCPPLKKYETHGSSCGLYSHLVEMKNFFWNDVDIFPQGVLDFLNERDLQPAAPPVVPGLICEVPFPDNSAENFPLWADYQCKAYLSTSPKFVQELQKNRQQMLSHLPSLLYESQAEGIDESRREQELKKINKALLTKLQELETDIFFSSGGFFTHICAPFYFIHTEPSVSLSLSCRPMTGPEFVTEENCIFVGMVADDVDVSELVDTISTLGRDIEESGRVTALFIL